MCAYDLVGHLIQGSPERLLVLPPLVMSIFPVSPSCTCILRPSIYRPYGRHSVVHVLFHGLIQRVYSKVPLSVLTSCMDGEVS